METVKLLDLTGVEIALNMNYLNVALHELSMRMGFPHDLTMCMEDRHIKNGVATNHAPKTSTAPAQAKITVEKLLVIRQGLNNGLHGFGSLDDAIQAKDKFFELVDAALEPVSG